MKVIAYTIAVFQAFGAAEARAAQTAPPAAIIQVAWGSTHPIHVFGDLPPPPDSDNSTPASASGSTVSSAEPVPELPTWAMILLCFAGLGLARFKGRRKDRLSPGIE